jgi:hypothetical protein
MRVLQQPGNAPDSIWQRAMARLRPAPIASAAALRAFLGQRASFIAQKCAIDYCRGKTGLASYALFTEKPFLDALEVCRWETFALVLGDLFILAEGHLRAHAAAAQRAALASALLALHAEELAGLPAPAHLAGGWGDSLASFQVRFMAAQQGGPPDTLALADHSARRLFDTLPIHLSMRELDQEIVYGAVRFRMVAVSQEMQRRFDAARLIAQLAGGSAK